MTTDHDPRTRVVLSWLREEAHENAESVLLRALDEVDTTPQRRRSARTDTYAKLIAAAAAVLVVAVIGYQFLPGSGGVAGQPSIAPSPRPMLVASGTFRAKGAPVELDATGAGDSVTGTMTVGEATEGFTVDLECTLTAKDGRILIGGDTTESTMSWVTKGGFSAIVLKPGSPMHAVFGSESDAPSATSCLAFLEGIVDQPFTTDIGDGALEPITGTVQLGP
jgi:hypothetical protein